VAVSEGREIVSTPHGGLATRRGYRHGMAEDKFQLHTVD